MANLKRYKVLVTEIHTDTVWVEASSQEEVKVKAIYEADCEYDHLYDCEIRDEEELR